MTRAKDMIAKKWVIYGAYGYTGQIVIAEAQNRGMAPLISGRNPERLRALSEDTGLPFQVCDLSKEGELDSLLADADVVLHCAGPFSATSKPMLAACLRNGCHYLDITGEIEVFEHALSLGTQASKAGITICPGVGFDVIPTDCIAATLVQAMPDASHLSMGFDSRSGLSPGTAKSSVEGLQSGGKIRENGEIVSVPLASETRRIDFGDGEKMAMTIPWGDVATAFHTTGIKNIKMWVPASPTMIKRMKQLNWIRPLLRIGLIQRLLRKQIDKKVRGPSASERRDQNTYVWGEVRNPDGKTLSARLVTASGYAMTGTGSVAVVQHLLEHPEKSGATTPARLMGAGFAASLPGSGAIEIV